VAATACGKVLPPSWGSYLGAFTDFKTRETYNEDHVSDRRITAFEQLAGHRLSWVYFSQQWYRGLRFPRERVLTIWRHGAVPYIAFLPSSGVFYGPGPKQHNPERRYTLQHIIDGVFDAQLRSWADGARALGVPLLVSFGAEVNDEWGPWNARWNGADQTDGYGDPTYPDGVERYRDAFRHLVRLVRAEGATNVAFVFHVDSYRPYHGWNTVEGYYPGDAYVDWLGISVYGTLDPRVPMSPFARKLDVSGVYPTLTRLSRRPIAIVEMGTVENPAGQKAAWIQGAFQALRSGRYPRVRAAVWWSMDSGANTRIDSSPEALAAFRSGVEGTFFTARLRFAGDCRPPPPAAVSATPGPRSTILVRWSPVEVASAYEVWRDGRLVVTTKETSWLDTTATPGPTHSYHVRAVSPGGRSV
jgi:Glycosyl hydrolase family 26